jgi:predicted DNA-binding antitoxin AbrB/MazE fold protein
MTIDVDAVYEDGVLKLKRPVNLPERAEVHVTIQAPEPARTTLGRKLLELRSRIAASGVPALGWDEIEGEVAARRGGWRESR